MKFERSKALHERACATAPGGIHSNVRAAWQPHPMFYARGQGSHVWDADGNEFIDYVLARGPLLLGHSPAPLIEAVKRQLDVGLMYAGQCELEIEATERFCRLVPCAELVRFACSGSEAVHAAMRLARGITGRQKIIRFEGHYHGWFDNAFWNYAPPLDQAGPPDDPVPIPASLGQAASDRANLVVCPWNDPQRVKSAFERHPGQIAAVLCEPIMCNTGAIMPEPDFLESLRELCTHHGALLIFDEIITGFRVSLGGAQELLGVTPDLATFAKGMAAGFPVSALAGKREYMKLLGDLSITHSGTYNSNGPCMAATVAALDMLAADGSAILTKLHARSHRLMDGLQRAGEKAGRRITIRGVPGVFFLGINETEPVSDYRSFARQDKTAYSRFWSALQDRGIRTIPGGLWFISTAHTDEDIDRTLAAAGEAFKHV